MTTSVNTTAARAEVDSSRWVPLDASPPTRGVPWRAVVVFSLVSPAVIMLSLWALGIRGLSFWWLLPSFLFLDLAVLLMARKWPVESTKGSPETSDPRVTRVLHELAALDDARSDQPFESLHLETFLLELIDLDREVDHAVRSEIRSFFAHRGLLATELSALIPHLGGSSSKARAERQLRGLSILHPELDWRYTLVAFREITAQCDAASIDPLSILPTIEGPDENDFSRMVRDAYAHHREVSRPRRVGESRSRST